MSPNTHHFERKLSCLILENELINIYGQPWCPNLFVLETVFRLVFIKCNKKITPQVKKEKWQLNFFLLTLWIFISSFYSNDDFVSNYRNILLLSLLLLFVYLWLQRTVDNTVMEKKWQEILHLSGLQNKVRVHIIQCTVKVFKKSELYC